MKSYTPYFMLLWSAVGIAKAAKIIIVPPIMFESHMYIFKTLASALHERGHRTVFLLSEGRDIAPSNHYSLQRYPGIFNSTTSDAFLQSKMRNIFSGRLTAIELFDILDRYTKNCDMMVGNRALIQGLKKEKFDLLLVDPNDMCGFVIAHLLGVKYAVFSTGLWYPAEVGAPAPLAYVPEFNSLLTDHMNLLQRMKNTGVYLISRLGISFLVLPKYERIMQKYNLLPEKSMYDLVHGSSLWMLCTDVALEFPRPTLPNVVYVGGILTKPASPLPEDLQRWVNGANEHGFVLVSFGAGVKYLSDDIANKLAGALGRLPQKVIWRFSGTKPKNLGNNTKLIEWLPQNDLLGHSNIKAFLSHGGLNSIFETMYHGVPVVGIPLFGDHYDTMTRVQAKGMGILLEWKTVTEGELYEALVQVINNPSYRQTAQKLSEIHKDQPGHPVNRTVYWIDYILRHNGAHHLRAAVHKISFCQYFLLDVAFVLLLGAALFYFLLSWVTKFIYRKIKSLWSRNKHSTVNGHYHNGILNGKYKRNGHIKHEKKVK
ncbi:2-hydroxyacylsphingosine 1-beta-galactosyltransferase isoform X1 [Camelus dromedarius]|uniref:2-hydroxyacylsphingosine 1-beta-galactosyltransferase n=8 Tax=Camelus TaxID=9836 RepID=A0A8B8RJW7_CAMFR|nr:2-hydroxyacylsphingosine 1-beta-galactosyltransferase [Camelus dromedarius]XP_031322788.1 2-hydroxyacylsphingosine 1-beta-galactosyltransferase [Camelus dromedarius]XP_031322791.1 2-hydroxyacylsphingosine 1-beta-galactosyltransferase [Camelus dromedarius]XP_032318241.1 2-hydroxyacylsphingosine 1-beta-galactosyltransferase [Camelus ferus]XP_032318242.1 2-hydroxyacylsphingosine 1-beta-galactosyltransferase [Camelus ferus]XP_032318243.1 2-hydroxyacylsphingosine 1-beta-galactosyltransferase [Ca